MRLVRSLFFTFVLLSASSCSFVDRFDEFHVPRDGGGGGPLTLDTFLPLFYDGTRIECAYRADLIVEQAVIVEVKAVDVIPKVYMRQLRTYATLADCRVGLLLNFGAPTLKEGIKRIVNGFPA